MTNITQPELVGTFYFNLLDAIYASNVDVLNIKAPDEFIEGNLQEQIVCTCIYSNGSVKTASGTTKESALQSIAYLPL